MLKKKATRSKGKDKKFPKTKEKAGKKSSTKGMPKTKAGKMGSPNSSAPGDTSSSPDLEFLNLDKFSFEMSGRTSVYYRELIERKVEEYGLKERGFKLLLLAASSCASKDRLSEALTTLLKDNEELIEELQEFVEEEVSDLSLDQAGREAFGVAHLTSSFPDKTANVVVNHTVAVLLNRGRIFGWADDSGAVKYYDLKIMDIICQLITTKMALALVLPKELKIAAFFYHVMFWTQTVSTKHLKSTSLRALSLNILENTFKDSFMSEDFLPGVATEVIMWFNTAFRACKWEDFEEWVMKQAMMTTNKLEHIATTRPITDSDDHPDTDSKFVYYRNSYPDKMARYGIPQMDSKVTEAAIMANNPSRPTEPLKAIVVYCMENLFKRYSQRFTICFTSFPSDSTFNVLDMLAYGKYDKERIMKSIGKFETAKGVISNANPFMIELEEA